MSKKNKAKNNQRNQQSSNPIKTDSMPIVTIETVAASVTESEFEKNKGFLISQIKEELKRLEEQKTSLEEAINRSTDLKQELQSKIDELGEEKKTLQDELKIIKPEYDEAIDYIENKEVEAESIIDDAKKEAKKITDEATNAAKEITDSAEKDRFTVIANAEEEARAAWKKQIDSLYAQIEDISKREKELNDAKIQLEKDRQDFEIQKETLDELKAHVNKLKAKYLSLDSPLVEELKLDLKDEQEKYSILLGKYNALSGKYNEAQILLDRIKTEMENSSGKKMSVREVVIEMQEFKEKYEKLASIYEKYPDDEHISALENKAKNVDRLETEKKELEEQRDRYREDAEAIRRANKELEVIKSEVDATKALNKELLKELESHKAALESRTGDACPSLSKVDSEVEDADFIKDILRRTQRQSLTSLKDIVSHVKNYAGSRKKEEQLFYKDNDIRAFLAGMAVSRLIILQGMSGTGKSSLPRIFSEAISGFNKLIPVESSWRDRNELLGYYNDFNKKFNAKSFTIALYKSSKNRCQQIPTFIVLDEMNLARIEYYFSDFLAILQEPDHKKWLVELVSSDMRTLPMELSDSTKKDMAINKPDVFKIWEKIEKIRQGNLEVETSDEEKETITSYLANLGMLTGAKDLIDGRKIKVTDNIWFVGTANQDESTFEISDKVYDRAQVVSLNQKGKSEGRYQPVEKKYISVDSLQELFNDAIANNKYRYEIEKRLDSLDAVLIDEFDVSFGNRIVTQTIDFAAVFIAAGGTLEDALDYQISTKILRKVISSDRDDAFLKLLEETKDYPETQRLINKKIRELK